MLHKPTTPAFIYALRDPRSGAIRYVGKSTNPERRLRRHLKDARDGKTNHKARWIASVLRDGFLPELTILEFCPRDGWDARERFWIRHLREQGLDLTNLTPGGDGVSPSEETRAKMRAAKLGKPAHNRGKRASVEARQKQSESARRRFERMSADERQDYVRHAMKGQRSTSRSGWTHTPDAKKKIQAASIALNRPKRLLTPDQVTEIRELLRQGIRGRRIAEQFSVTESIISGIKHKKRYLNG